MDMVITLLLDAITLGAIYALIAVGYTMVYGIIKLINFAHGEVFMIGTFIGWLLISFGHWPLAVAIVISMGVCAMLGVVIDFSAYLPLRRKHPIADVASIVFLAGFSFLTIVYFGLKGPQGGPTALKMVLAVLPLTLFVIAIMGLFGKLGRQTGSVSSDRLSALITAIGMSLSLQTIVQLIWGADYQNIPETTTVVTADGTEETIRLLPEFLNSAIIEIGSAKLLGKQLIIWVAALVLMAGLNALVSYTKIGKAMRACALDKQTASLMGVNVNFVIAVTFMIGSAMAAIAGILVAVKVGGNISFRMGYYPGVIAFAAAVLGGIGNIRGALVGGLLIGATQALAESRLMSEYAVKGLDKYSFAFAFGLMIMVILFRPWGIYGKPEAKRA